MLGRSSGSSAMSSRHLSFRTWKRILTRSCGRHICRGVVRDSRGHDVRRCRNWHTWPRHAQWRPVLPCSLSQYGPFLPIILVRIGCYFHWQCLLALTTAVAALGNLTVVWKTCFLQTFEIILNGNRPALSEIRTLRLGAKEEPDHILAV